MLSGRRKLHRRNVAEPHPRSERKRREGLNGLWSSDRTDRALKPFALDRSQRSVDGGSLKTLLE